MKKFIILFLQVSILFSYSQMKLEINTTSYKLNVEKRTSSNLMIIGKSQYEDENGLIKDNHFYYFYEVDNIIIEGEKFRKGLKEENASSNNFTEIQPNGYITTRFNIIQEGNYYINIRILRYGNTQAKFNVKINEKTYKLKGWGTEWLKFGPIFLKKGENFLKIEECGDEPLYPSNRLIAIDCIEITTDPNVELFNKVKENPQNFKDKYWLPKTEKKLKNPEIIIGQKRFRIIHEFEDTEPLIICNDKVISLKNDINFEVMNVEEKEFIFNVDKNSSPKAEIIFFENITPLILNPNNITPNDDFVNDEIKILFNEKIEKIYLNKTDGNFQKEINIGKEEFIINKELNLTDGFYYIIIPQKNISYIGIFYVNTSACPLISAIPPIISPNNDGVCDQCIITYYLPSSGIIKIKITDKEGKTIKLLMDNEEKKEGIYKIIWNGKDFKEEPVKDGEYFCEILLNGINLMKRKIKVESKFLWKRRISQEILNFFPIGMWFSATPHPENLTGKRYFEVTFKDIAEHGFNTIVCGGNIDEIMEVAEKYNLKIILNIMNLTYSNWFEERIPLTEEEAIKFILPIIEKTNKYKSFIGFYIADEPEINEKFGEKLYLLSRIVENYGYPSLTVLIGLDRIKFYAEKLKPSILFIDVYPLRENSQIGDFRNIYYTKDESVDYIKKAISNVSKETPVWIILQTHGFSGWHRQPTVEEIRRMTYEAISQGAKGIFYFIYQTQQTWIGLVDENYKETDRYKEIKELSEKIRKISSLLLNLRIIDNIGIIEGGGNKFYKSGLIETHKDTYGNYYFIYVNRDVENQQKVKIYFKNKDIPYKVLKVIDIITEKNLIFKKNEEEILMFEDVLQPGEGKVVKLEGGL